MGLEQHLGQLVSQLLVLGPDRRQDALEKLLFALRIPQEGVGPGQEAVGHQQTGQRLGGGDLAAGGGDGFHQGGSVGQQVTVLIEVMLHLFHEGRHLVAAAHQVVDEVQLVGHGLGPAGPHHGRQTPDVKPVQLGLLGDAPLFRGEDPIQLSRLEQPVAGDLRAQGVEDQGMLFAQLELAVQAPDLLSQGGTIPGQALFGRGDDPAQERAGVVGVEDLQQVGFGQPALQLVVREFPQAREQKALQALAVVPPTVQHAGIAVENAGQNTVPVLERRLFLLRMLEHIHQEGSGISVHVILQAPSGPELLVNLAQSVVTLPQIRDRARDRLEVVKVKPLSQLL